MWWALPLERNSFHFGKDGMSQNMTGQIKKVNETGNYRRTKMKKRWFFRNFGSKAAGLRNRGRSFWILYWKKTVLPARKFFTGHLSLIRELGRQTVYRLVNKLEEIGAISRKKYV